VSGKRRTRVKEAMEKHPLEENRKKRVIAGNSALKKRIKRDRAKGRGQRLINWARGGLRFWGTKTRRVRECGV